MHTDLCQQAWFVLINPTAGGGLSGRRWPDYARRLEKVLPDAKLAFSEANAHAMELVGRAIEDGYRYVMAVGGDGTHHEVVNGIMRQRAVPSHEVTYALLPVGTGNDWVRNYRIPADIDRWLAMIQSGHTRTQSVGLATYQHEGQTKQRYFANVAGLAYDGYVVRYAHQHPPAFGGNLGYLFLTLRCLFQYTPQRAHLYLDDNLVVDRFYTINAGIGRYSGGGMQLVPHAQPNDDRLAVTYAGPVSRLGVLLNTYRFYNGTLGRHPLITTTHARRLRIEAADDGPILLEADGEFLGESPVEIEIMPGALKFVTPEE